MTSRRVFLSLAVATSIVATSAALVSVGGAIPAVAQTPPVSLAGGLAISGYDPVAYFTEKKAVKGNPAIALDHGGAKYLFASEANREAFKKEPAKFEPQYGGYCAWAVSQGYTAPSDPNAFTVHNGKLFLNYNQSVKTTWEKDIPGNVVKGDQNWPKVIGKK